MKPPVVGATLVAMRCDGLRQRRCPDTGHDQPYDASERGRAMDAVTAAVLADAAFDAVGEATQFSTQRYREKIEQFRQTREPTSGMEVARDGIKRRQSGILDGGSCQNPC